MNARYGDVFRVARKDGKESWPIGGGSVKEAGMATPRAISFGNVGDQKIGHGGQTSTQIVVLSKPPRSYMVLPLGESDHPESGHWDDQAAKLFSEGKAKDTFFMDREGLQPHVTSTKKLEYNSRRAGMADSHANGGLPPGGSAVGRWIVDLIDQRSAHVTKLLPSLGVVAALSFTVFAFAAENAPVKKDPSAPRYKLRVGQELNYAGDSDFAYEGGNLLAKITWKLLVVRQNPDGGWRLLVRNGIARGRKMKGDDEAKFRPESVSLAWCDMTPDGRVADNPTLDFSLDLRTILPQLPPPGTTRWQAARMV